MAVPNATKGGYWDFLDTLVETEPLAAMAECRSKGAEIVASFKREPMIEFGSFSIDFNSRTWDLSAVTELNVPRRSLVIAFRDTPLDEAAKVYLLNSLIRGTAKVQTIVAKTKRALSLLTANDVGFGGIATLDVPTVSAMLEAKERETSMATAAAYARAAASFLEFFSMTFARLSDTGLVPWLASFSKRRQITRRTEGHPAIPDAYLDALLSACLATMRDDEAPHDDRITAATTLIFSQTGLRSADLLGAEAHSLELVEGACGMPDLVYLNYRSIKGGRGDGRARPARTIINDISLEAYLWLEDACEGDRGRLGVSTLVVYPGQRGRYCSGSGFLQKLRRFVLFRHDQIPCVVSRESDWGISTSTVDEVLKGNTLGFCERTGLSPDDIVAYPVTHSFRVTVATKMCEQGVDMHYIREHMTHLDEDTTAGYIRSDRQIERANSDLVYRTIFGDGAKLIGRHADEFTGKVQAFLATLDEHVKQDVDKIVEAASARFPLRSKLGGVCIRCGNVVPCPASDGADEILCAFGVCPNQCHMYFMAADTLDMARVHMRLVEENVARGQAKAARNELAKAKNIIETTLLPELESLDEQVSSLGARKVIERFPALSEIVTNRTQVEMEVARWRQMNL